MREEPKTVISLGATGLSLNLMSQMRAIQVSELGGPEVLKRVFLPVPEPAPGEVLLEIEAAGVNFADILWVRGGYLEQVALPFVPGMEAVGRASKLGEGVSGIGVGQRYAVLHSLGGFAEYSAAPADHLVPIPDQLSDLEAAAFPISYYTAYFALKEMAHFEPGEWVLIEAAAGALGTALIQLANLEGLNVIAAASTPEKLALAQRLGARGLINYREEDLPVRVQSISSGHGLDGVFETVGGPNLQKNLEAMAEFGRMVFIGNASGEFPRINPFYLMSKNLTFSAMWLSRLMQYPERVKRAGAYLAERVARDHVRPVVGAVFDLEAASEAFNTVLERKNLGKVIIKIKADL